MRSSPSTIRQFLLGCFAIALALLAQRWLDQDSTVAAVVVYAIAAIVAIVAFRQSATDLVAQNENQHQALAANWGWIGPLLIATSFVVNSGMLWRLNEMNPSAPDWQLYLLSLGLLLAGGYLSDPSPWQRRQTGANDIESVNDIDGVNVVSASHHTKISQERLPVPLLLALICAIALFFRLYRFDSLPFGTWFDEAEYAMQAMRIQTVPGFLPIFSEIINGPAHYLYLVALSFDLFGVSTLAVRAVNVAMGMISILFAYGVGKELFDRRSGLLLAFLLAVSGWHVILSRFGMHSTSTTPLFTLVTVYFLLRALRTERVADFVWAGIGAGLGLSFYTSFRVFLPSVAIFVLYYLLHGWLTKSVRFNSRLIGGLLVSGLAGWLTIAPLAIFAWRQPDIFWERIQKTYIFADKAPEERLPVLLTSIKKHLLMFNVEGDPNGRHDLPGAPMLDSISGALFVLGVALALWRIRNPVYLLLLSWCGLSLLGGILSVDFEAPQSLRSNGALAAAYLLAALPLYDLWRAWDRGARPYSNWLLWPLTLLMLLMGWRNYDFYFNRYATDFAAWNAWSTPETLAAALLNHLPPDTEPYLTNYFRGHPTVHFLTNGMSYGDIQTTAHLPLEWPADKDVELLLNYDNRNIYEEARRLYPNGTFEEITSPFPGGVVLFRVHLTQNDLRSIEGLTSRYYPNETWSGEPAFSGKDLQIDSDWSTAMPLAPPFSVEWEGVLRVETYGIYQLVVHAPKHAELYVDESLVAAGEGDLSGNVVLAEGNHAIRLRVVGAAEFVNLSWVVPNGQLETVPASALLSGEVSANGLLGRFFPNGEWQPPEQFSRIDPELNLYFHIIPMSRPYSVEWVGKIAIPETGEYGFALESISESSLFLDEQQIVEVPSGNHVESARLYLEQGLHDLRVRFSDHEDHSHINLYWSPPGFGQQPVPAQVLFPPQANYDRVTIPKLAQLYASLQPQPPTAPTSANNEVLPAEVTVFPLHLNAPIGIAAGRGGRIYVADTGNQRMVVLNNQGELVSAVMEGEGAFVEPFDVATDEGGQVYLLDAATGKVSIFDPDGLFVGNLATPQGAPDRSRGIFVDIQGRVWFAHTAGSRVFAVDAQGNPAQALDVAGEEGAQPIDVAVGASGNIYVTDGDRHKLYFFTAQGVRLFSLDLEPANTLAGAHMAVDLNGFLYVTVPESARVLKFSADGHQLGFFDLRAAGVQRPVGVAIDLAGKIWVADVDRGHVAVITPPEASELPSDPSLDLPTESQPDSPLLDSQPDSPLPDPPLAQPESPLPAAAQ